MVRDTLTGTTVERSQNHPAPTWNQDRTQQFPGQHREDQNQLLELEDHVVEHEILDLEKHKRDSKQQNPELDKQLQSGPENQTGPPEPTNLESRLQPWGSQRARPGVSLPSPPRLLSCPSLPLPCPDLWTPTPLTHFRPFSSLQECVLVRRTHSQLVHSGFYWGPMDMEQAHQTLQHTPLGTFLIRDSGQPDVFFTLSYHGDQGPTSIRVLLDGLKFHLHGSRKTFASLFSMLHFYMDTSLRRLRWAWRKERPMTLQQLCRRRVVEVFGADSIDSLPGLNRVATQYLHNYPYSM
ncbi:suppressor of cytokine signaling 1 [Esox lucius]|uniref:Suppressor of cytokine signaling 1-like n=1 Tax=Esox lucius TaxID=8010 RepID=A0A6Q2Z2G5_ESOLU|nr:suppressor of cytokine signaling 1 [Esox lucius]